MRILIAEEDIASRIVLCRLLGKYGRCDLATDGLEALDAFFTALNDKTPYHLVCLDIAMPRADGVKMLRTIRVLEGRYGVADENRAKVIITTVPAEAHLLQCAFEYGCEAYATKPLDTDELLAVMEKLGAGGGGTDRAQNRQAGRSDWLAEWPEGDECAETSYFKRVQALSNHRLDVLMGTGATICFDFRSRLNGMRFGRLRDEQLFRGVRTDGDYIIFESPGRMPVKISAAEFMDLVLIDRRR